MSVTPEITRLVRKSLPDAPTVEVIMMRPDFSDTWVVYGEATGPAVWPAIREELRTCAEQAEMSDDPDAGMCIRFAVVTRAELDAMDEFSGW